MDGKVSLKYVDELIKEEIQFTVPDYQRGYKWTEENIDELLSDIISLENGEEYCLMPIIVRHTDKGETEIVDGQQRLTTLKLIIDSIKDDNTKCNYKIPKGCYNNIDEKNKEKAETKINKSNKEKLKEKLLPIGKRSPFYFIWYEINGSELDAINTFNRVNSWKIPLKESELAKAYILSAFGPDKYTERRRANEKWASLEKLFNNPDFFSFFTLGKSKEQMKEYESAHMDLLLELWAETEFGNTYVTSEGNRYPIYKMICKEKIDGAKLLAGLEKIANVMKFIHEDRISYHLASYLLLRGKISITEIIKLYVLSSDKTSLQGAKALLAKTEQENFLISTTDSEKLAAYIGKLNYWEKDTDRKVQNDILTLYNICDSLENNSYYQFYPTVLHSKQDWTLEHIHAKNEREKDENEINSSISSLCKLRGFSAEERSWIKDQKETYKKGEQKNLNAFYDEILYPMLSGESIDDIKSKCNSNSIAPWYEASIMNLALLPHNENSTFNNSTYLEKIEKLKSFNLSSYIPKCTLECFSKNAYVEEGEQNEFWTENRGKKYLETIISTITQCLNKLNEQELNTVAFSSDVLQKTDYVSNGITKVHSEARSNPNHPEKAYCLRDVRNILIPDFQRSYAQGRNTPQSREIIENFINDIKKVLIGETPVLSLDFVYGRKNNGSFEPYDGQQRLTTLYLVYLYMLRKADYDQSNNIKWKNFTLNYRTSIEAGRFIDAISDKNNQIFFKQNEKWKLCHLEAQLYIDYQMLADDAVRNMIRTLSVIDEKLGDIDASAAAGALDNITFSIYDELPNENPEVFYLKTNTRGLPLTPFENFRSKYESYLKECKITVPDDLYVTRERMNSYFNWFSLQDDKKTPDENLMNLFVSYFSSLYSLYGLKEEDTEKSKKFVPFQYFADILGNDRIKVETIMHPLLKLLDFLTVNEEETNLSRLTLTERSDSDRWFSKRIRSAILNNENSDFLLLVSFFFKAFDKGSFDEKKYRAYVRVVTNLINNSVSIADNRNLYLDISESDLSEHELLKILSTHYEEMKNKYTKSTKTINEEIKKLKLIKSDSAWRTLIEKAESTAFADGFIDFLLDGIEKDDRDEFSNRLNNFGELFYENGVQENKKFDVVKAFIRLSSNEQETRYFDTSREHWRNDIFSNSRDKDQGKADIYKNIILELLTSDLCNIDYISGDSSTWSYKIRESLIHNPWFIKWMISTNNNFSLFWVGDANNATPVFSKPYSHQNICWDTGGWSYDTTVIQNKQITAFFRTMWGIIHLDKYRFYIIDDDGNDVTNSTTYMENKNHLVISAYYRQNGWIDFTYQDRNFYLLYQGIIVTMDEFSSGIIDWTTSTERSIYENQNGNCFAGNLKDKNEIISLLNRLVDES